jgi:PIN domain nuclease of toxin-antitoxin system
VKQVIDSSVVIAFLRDEPGGDVLLRDDGPFLLSTVNLAEVFTKLIELGLSIDDANLVLRRLPIVHVDHNREDARRAAELRPLTLSLGRSLGDRICLALGQRFDVPVLTADKEWAALDIGIDVRLIR